MIHLQDMMDRWSYWRGTSQKLHVTRCWGKAGRTSQGKTRYPRTREKRRIGTFRFYYLPPSQPGTGPGCVWKSIESFKAVWTAKVSRYSGMLQAAGTEFNLLPVLFSTLGGWHPDAHRVLCSVATTIAARGLSILSRARSILFQRHASLLVTNNGLCLMSGLLSDIWGWALFVRSANQKFCNSVS